MAKVADDILTWVQTSTGGQPYSQQFPEAASQTFKKGWIVDLNGAGFVIDPATDTPIRILGIAAEDAHNDTTAGTHQIDVILAHPANTFAANCKGAALADLVLTQAMIGAPLAIQRDTTNNRIFLNGSLNAGLNARAFTLAIGQNQPNTPSTGFGPFGVGDTNVRLIFQWDEKFTYLSSS
jgi:hypothetical protein